MPPWKKSSWRPWLSGILGISVEFIAADTSIKGFIMPNVRKV